MTYAWAWPSLSRADSKRPSHCSATGLVNLKGWGLEDRELREQAEDQLQEIERQSALKKTSS